MELNYNAQRPVPLFNGDTVVAEYEAYCSYDRRTGEHDEGSDVREVMEWRQKKGIKDRAAKVHKIGPYLALEPKNLEHLYEACWLFECVGIGFEVPESAEIQFSEGKPWSVVAGAEVVGGHYVPITGRPNPAHAAFITWAKRCEMTNHFYETYNDEAWAYVSPEMFKSVTGKDYEGFNAEQLDQYLTQASRRP